MEQHFASIFITLLFYDKVNYATIYQYTYTYANAILLIPIHFYLTKKKNYLLFL